MITSTRTLLVFLFLTLISGFAAADITYYDNTLEMTYQNTTVTDQVSFSAAAGSSATLNIKNGGSFPRVKSLVIVLNGVTIVTSSEVNLRVGSYTAVVPMKGSNTMKITATADNAARVRVTLTGGGSGGGGGGGGGSTGMSGDGGSGEISDDDGNSGGGGGGGDGGGGGGGTSSGVDITALNFDAANGSHRPGQPFVVSWFLKNVGDTRSGGINCKVYASKDSRIVSTDRLLGNFNYPALNPNQQRRQQAKVTLKANFPEGDYYVGVVVSTTPEGSTDNNTAFDSTRITLVKGTGGGGGGSPNELFSSLAGMGDSLLAGFIDGSLVEQYQIHNFGSKIAHQANADFDLPLVSDPGNPALRVMMNNGQIQVLPEREPGRRINPGARIDNFSVPGTTVFTSLRVKNLNSSNPPVDDPFHIVLGGNRTQIAAVKNSKPSLVILWLGSNDVLDMVLSTDPEAHTDIALFRRDYQTIVNQLKNTGATIVAANLPDITTIPFLMDENDWGLLRNLGLPEGGKIPATLILDFLITGNLPRLTDDVILDKNELKQIDDTVTAMNQELERILEQANIPYVDMFTITRNWANSGITVNGVKLTMRWQGGLFGLDGIHPTITAHAIIANRLIDLINEEYNLNLPSVNVAEAMNQDPNFSSTGVATSTGDPDEAALAVKSIEQLRSVIRKSREMQREAEHREQSR